MRIEAATPAIQGAIEACCSLDLPLDKWDEITCIKIIPVEPSMLAQEFSDKSNEITPTWLENMFNDLADLTPAVGHREDDSEDTTLFFSVFPDDPDHYLIILLGSQAGIIAECMHILHDHINDDSVIGEWDLADEDDDDETDTTRGPEVHDPVERLPIPVPDIQI